MGAMLYNGFLQLVVTSYKHSPMTSNVLPYHGHVLSNACNVAGASQVVLNGLHDGLALGKG